MSESLQGALAALLDRCAPTLPQCDPDTFGRIPEDVMPARHLRPGPKFLLSVLDALDRHNGWKGTLKVTDGLLAKACGVTINTIGNWLRSLANAGLIGRAGRTCGRVITLLFRFRSGSTSPRTGGSELPQEPVAPSPRTGGTFPKNRPESPQKPGDCSKGKEENSKARSSSSSPAPGDTPTTAKTQTGGPPRGPSAPPPPTPSLDHHEQKLTSRWEAIPEAERSEIAAKVRADNPGMDRWPNLFRPLCLAELERRPEPEPSRADRDAALMSLLLDADDPAMRMASAATLCDSGRADLVVERIDFEVARRTGRQPVSGPPADPKSPCRPPG